MRKDAEARDRQQKRDPRARRQDQGRSTTSSSTVYDEEFKRDSAHAEAHARPTSKRRPQKIDPALLEALPRHQAALHAADGQDWWTASAADASCRCRAATLRELKLGRKDRGVR